MRFDYYSDLTFYNGSSWDRYFSSQADETITYDVLVVGSGMGGGILADATSNLGLRTLVLEAGPIRHLVNITDLPLPSVVESMDPYTVTGPSTLKGGVCFNLGGRSIYWSAVIPRMKPWELADPFWPEAVRTYLTTEGSPHPTDGSVLTGYERAERLFRLRPAETYPLYQRELLEKVSKAFPGYDVTQLPRSYHVPDSRVNPRPGSPDERTTGVFSTAALLTDSVMNPGRAGNEFLDVAVQHLVDQVVFDAGGRATGVEVLDLRNRVRRTFRARHVVLAGGTTESARLALTSRVQHPLLGIGLSDHPEAEVHFDPQANLGVSSQGNLFLRSDTVDDPDAGFSCELALNWQFWDVHTPDDVRWRQEHPPSNPPHSTIKFLFRNPLVEANTVKVTGSTYEVRLDPPRRVALARAKALAGEVARFFGSEPLDQLEVTAGSLTYHLAGSMRMGATREEGVVSTDLRFWDHENLWCCDLSVFPDVPASNPSLTLGALAQRLAVTLAAELRPAQPARA